MLCGVSSERKQVLLIFFPLRRSSNTPMIAGILCSKHALSHKHTHTRLKKYAAAKVKLSPHQQSASLSSLSAFQWAENVSLWLVSSYILYSTEGRYMLELRWTKTKTLNTTALAACPVDLKSLPRSGGGTESISHLGCYLHAPRLLPFWRFPAMQTHAIEKERTKL